MEKLGFGVPSGHDKNHNDASIKFPKHTQNHEWCSSQEPCIIKTGAHPG